MHLIVGLGNPGRDYAKTRHNAGFMAVARLAERHKLAGAKTRFRGQAIEGRIGEHKVLLLCPMTYMNRSGPAVREALDFYKLTPTDGMIVVDDVALPVGRIRIRPSGSAGGHNGLIDVEAAIGTSEYPRLRIGIDEPGQVTQKDYVLGKFTAEQLRRLDPALDRACDAIEYWLSADIDRVMARYNAAD